MQSCNTAAYKAALARHTAHWVGSQCTLVYPTALGFLPEHGICSLKLVDLVDSWPPLVKHMWPNVPLQEDSLAGWLARSLSLSLACWIAPSHLLTHSITYSPSHPPTHPLTPHNSLTHPPTHTHLHLIFNQQLALRCSSIKHDGTYAYSFIKTDLLSHCRAQQHTRHCSSPCVRRRTGACRLLSSLRK